MYDSCLAARRSKLVDGMCSMLPYDTGICCYAFFKSGIDKSTEWSTIPACPSFMCFFNRGGTEGTNSSKNLCSMFVNVLFYVNLCTGLILWVVFF